MHSWSSITLLGFVFRACAVHRYELTAVGALLTCFAVVLNVSPFARAPKREAAQAATEHTEQLVGSSSIARSKIGAGTRPDRVQSNTEPMDVPEQIRPWTELSSVPGDAFARVVFLPVRPKDRDFEMQALQTRQDRETPDQVTQPLATIAGVWVPNEGACSVRNFREGLLPTIINTDGAWAGETFCIFKKQKQTETGWRVVANCSNPREQWTTDVRLTLRDDRLIWTSKRGTQAYSRCAPDFLMAAAR